MVLSSGAVEQQDVLVVGDRIEAVGQVQVQGDIETIDGTGLLLLPGMIDPQVHFCDPGLEHKEDLYTATRACAKGGLTSFLEMPNTRK